ncbi:MAG: hypothetical protein Q8R06_15760 [Polaromonas sp.]|uniref:hypothetical protein n=1 Tax=Polaromonas sp. TaxID=1869339 RepID=UPI002733EAF2|nr:hypothetical protein [Polaromonas sp.]MDP3798573.1 hypothetical protein [Polaromonas sp.]
MFVIAKFPCAEGADARFRIEKSAARRVTIQAQELVNRFSGLKSAVSTTKSRLRPSGSGERSYEINSNSGAISTA